MSKVFESILLLNVWTISARVQTSNMIWLQEGSQLHSTDLCIYALKEFIEYYKKRSTSVIVTMLDASKAFDRVNFW